MKNIYTHYLMLLYFNCKTGLSNLCKNIVKKLFWKFTGIFQNQVINFLNTFTEHGKIIADYTKSMERNSKLLCRNVIV